MKVDGWIDGWVYMNTEYISLFFSSPPGHTTGRFPLLYVPQVPCSTLAVAELGEGSSR